MGFVSGKGKLVEGGTSSGYKPSTPIRLRAVLGAECLHIGSQTQRVFSGLPHLLVMRSSAP